MSKAVVMFSLIGACLLFTILGDRSACATRGGSSSRTSVDRNDRLATGVWGGDHIRAEVTDRGAEIEFDCAHGVIAEAIALNTKGGFDVPGKYAPEHGGPVRDNETSKGISVRYVGSLRDSEISLAIINADTKETIGTFTLTHGNDGRVMKCR